MERLEEIKKRVESYREYPVAAVDHDKYVNDVLFLLSTIDTLTKRVVELEVERERLQNMLKPFLEQKFAFDSVSEELVESVEDYKRAWVETYNAFMKEKDRAEKLEKRVGELEERATKYMTAFAETNEHNSRLQAALAGKEG